MERIGADNTPIQKNPRKSAQSALSAFYFSMPESEFDKVKLIIRRSFEL